MRGAALLRGIAGGLILVFGFVGAGAVAFPRQRLIAPQTIDASIPPLRVAGHIVSENGDPIGNAIDLVRKYAVGEIKLKLPDGRQIALGRNEFGLELDRLRITEFIKEARDPAGPLMAAHRQKPRGTPIDVPLPLKIDGERALSRLVDIKASLDSSPIDASIDLEHRRVRPEKVGLRLDVYGTLARMESAFRRGETVVVADVVEVAPTRTAAELGDVKFDSVLGFFETRYNTAKKFSDRTYNLRLAASKIDGRVLLPGEVFDFNGVVGPRDEAHGYRVATVIAQGELVDGIGGGTCQISGTLHAAAFFSGLEVTERSPHSRPSSYIKLGLDATVSYPNINFRFRNPFDFPVVLHEKVAGGVVRAEILGPQRKLTVSYFRRIDEVLPFDEVERESDKLPEGERVVVQRGTPGFIAVSSRLVRDGAYGERTKWTERYPPTTQIVTVGTGPSDQKPLIKEDAHPEYVADEYLVITQGPPARAGDLDSGMNETRVPGKTGEAGWIKKLGLEKTPMSGDAKGDKASEDEDKSKDKNSKDSKDSKDSKKDKDPEKKARDKDKKDPKKVADKSASEKKKNVKKKDSK